MNSSPELSLDGAVARALSDWSARSDPYALLLASLLFVAVLLLRRPIAAAAERVTAWVLGKLSIELSQSVSKEIDAALRVIVVASAALLVVNALGVPEVFGGVLRRLLNSVLIIAVFAAWYRLIEPMVAVIDPKKFSDHTVETNWIVRLGQFVVVLFGITALLALWGIDISSAITGVGVFGAGLAIAAQDLVRNLFAGMTNMSEERFSVGDWVAVEGGVEGIVTRIDVRSTTILGFDRVPRYVPNASLSDAIVLNKSRRDHRRIYWTVSLVRDATDAQVEAVCASLRTYLSESGDYVDDGSLLALVTPVGLSESAIEIMIYAFSRTTAYQPYLEVCGRLTLAIRRAVSEADTRLAYPTQTVVMSEPERPQ